MPLAASGGACVLAAHYGWLGCRKLNARFMNQSTLHKACNMCECSTAGWALFHVVVSNSTGNSHLELKLAWW